MLTNAIVVHLIADWIFQNDWMARNKANLSHPAAWVHGAIHFVAMLFIFPAFISLAIAIIHMLIDTRKPVQWWQHIYKQTTTGDYAIHVQIWLDQVFHITVIAIAAWLVSLARMG